MVNTQLVKLFILLSVLCSLTAQAQEPVASIDRSVISIEDSLTLTIRISDTGSYSGPDTTPLEKDFQVLGTSQSSRHSFINGRSESSTEWTIPLIPKRTGNLTIPPLTVGKSQTQRLTVSVQQAVPRSTDNAEPIFIESDVSANSVYVQQQLIFTVRVFQSVQLDNMSLSDIDLDNALVEKLSQNTFQRRIGNRPYRVHEIRYAIFPQQSGSLTIPEVVFSANELIQQRGFFNLPGQGRPVRRLTQQHTIDVLLPPDKFPQTAQTPWLPAEDLQIDESWSIDPQSLRVGDSVTRTITITARGLSGSQLPPFNFDHIDGARFYPDQGKTENTLNEQGVSSVRIDSAAIIPTRAGELTIPAYTLHWWDTRSGQLRQATLPAQQLQIKPAPAGASGNSQPLAIDHSTPVSEQPAVITTTTGNWLWKITTVIFALLWILTAGLWWRSQRHSDSQQKATTAPKVNTEQQHYKQLLEACRNKDNHQVRQHLIAWTQQLATPVRIHSLYDVERYFNDQQLSAQLHALEQQLYGEETSPKTLPFNDLTAVIKQLRQQAMDNRHSATTAQLPPLYSA